MSDETRKQIIKSIVYGYTATEIAEIYGFDIDIISKLIADNEDEIERTKKYIKEMRGEVWQ